MDQTTIGRMHTRFRLPAREAEGLRTRLAAVQSSLLNGALEAALEQAGARAVEEICIRRLHIPVRLRSVRGDSALAADWATPLATGSLAGKWALASMAPVQRVALASPAWPSATPCA